MEQWERACSARCPEAGGRQSVRQKTVLACQLSFGTCSNSEKIFLFSIWSSTQACSQLRALSPSKFSVSSIFFSSVFKVKLSSFSPPSTMRGVGWSLCTSPGFTRHRRAAFPFQPGRKAMTGDKHWKKVMKTSRFWEGCHRWTDAILKMAYRLCHWISVCTSEPLNSVLKYLSR